MKLIWIYFLNKNSIFVYIKVNTELSSITICHIGYCPI